MTLAAFLNDFHFIRPYWLLALLPFLAVVAMLIRSRLGQGNWPALCDAELLPYLLQDKVIAQSRWPLALGATGALLAIIALAGPTWERLPAPAFRNDAALVIALDLSSTMLAADLKPNRLTLARYKISDILRQRKDGQTALIAYSGDAFTVTPLTTDTDTIDNQLSALTPQIMPGDGNNLSHALDKAIELFKQAGLQKGQILLLTDGGGLEEGLAKAKSLGNYQLLVLGAGTADGAPIALESGDFLKDSLGNIVIDKVDTGSLEKLAQAGGGAYHALSSDDSDINKLFGTVTAKLQTQEAKNENLLLEQWRDNGPWFLLIVLPLAALSFRKGILTLLLAIFLPCPDSAYAFEVPGNWEDWWQTKDQQAQQAYRQGDYNKAADLFENPDWKAAAEFKSDLTETREMKEAHSAVGLYNQANVLAIRKEYENAIAYYTKALNKNPDQKLKEDIEFNKKLIEDARQKEQEDKKHQDQNQQSKDDNQDSKNQDQSQQNKPQNQDGQPAGQNQPQQDAEQSDEKNKADNKPELKPEQAQEELEKQAERQQAEDEKKQAQEQQKQDAAQEAGQSPKNEAQKDSKEAEPTQAIEREMSKEERQATEQWLKRIPDDPAGLLRRKFKYQYEQRGQP